MRVIERDGVRYNSIKVPMTKEMEEDCCGGYLIPEQFRSEIEDRVEYTQLYYDTEADYKGYVYAKESPLVVRKYPKWKFWKHGYLIRCKSNRINYE